MTQYRVVFQDEIKDYIEQFAIVHRYDSIADFKEAWNEFKEERYDELQNEFRYQTKQKKIELSFEQMIQKLFVSARYYHRKKSSTKPKTSTTRGSYYSISKEILDVIDEFIQHEAKMSRDKPANAWNWFYSSHRELIEKYKEQCLEDWEMSEDDSLAKMKKTFKNRYYRYRKNKE